MWKKWSLLAAVILVGALLLFWRQPAAPADWRRGDPELVIVTPLNAAVRAEFGRAFSAWHRERYGRPVRLDWRVVGGTADIRRYLQSPAAYGTDLFFGGGEVEQRAAARQGFTVPLDAVYQQLGDLTLYPEQVFGETWRTKFFVGTALHVYGICYNPDRLRELGVSPPAQWDDLTKPAYFGQLALADPTQNGSAAKAFETIIQQQCRRALAAADFDDEAIGVCESLFGVASSVPAAVPQGVPLAYPRAVEAGWRRGLALIQLLGANARAFAETMERVPRDVGAGHAAAGLCTDFDARAATARLAFVAPVGGTSVSCEPISLLRGAPHRVTAERFIAFVLRPEGQRLWCYRPGLRGGPEQTALWRLPIRRDFYPAADPAGASCYQQQRHRTAFDLAAPAGNAYALATNGPYVARWTGQHGGVHGDLIQAMCRDSGAELRAAWRAILDHGGPTAQPEALRLLTQLPDQPAPLTWASALDIARRYDRREYTRQWADCFRRNYRAAEKLALKKRP